MHIKKIEKIKPHPVTGEDRYKVTIEETVTREEIVTQSALEHELSSLNQRTSFLKEIKEKVSRQ